MNKINEPLSMGSRKLVSIYLYCKLSTNIEDCLELYWCLIIVPIKDDRKMCFINLNSNVTLVRERVRLFDV